MVSLPTSFSFLGYLVILGATPCRADHGMCFCIIIMRVGNQSDPQLVGHVG